jgi:hypothetical protein
MRLPSLNLIPALLFCLAMLVSGCSKSDDGTPKSPTANTIIVSLTGADVQRNGTLSLQGLNEIKKRSDKPALTVSFLRVRISDAALGQLAQFPNVRRIEAIDSHLSDQAIAKLKSTNPDVVVVK